MQTKLDFPSGIKLFSTPRYLEGGASVGHYDNFNFATHTGDISDTVIHNRKLLMAYFDLHNAPKWLNQTYYNICLDAQSNDCEGDAVITREKGVVCVVMTADCLPIFASNQSGAHKSALLMRVSKGF